MARGKYRKKRERKLALEKERQILEDLGLNSRIVKLLFNRSINELREMSEEDLLQIKGIGLASAKQIKDCIDHFPEKNDEIQYKF